MNFEYIRKNSKNDLVCHKELIKSIEHIELHSVYSSLYSESKKFI